MHLPNLKELGDVLFKFLLPFIFGALFTLIKVGTENRAGMSYDECNGMALDLVLVSGITYITDYAQGRTSHSMLFTFGADAVIVFFLLLVRINRAALRDKLTAENRELPETTPRLAAMQMIAGSLSILFAVLDIK
jgi:hypothetical protein